MVSVTLKRFEKASKSFEPTYLYGVEKVRFLAHRYDLVIFIDAGLLNELPSSGSDSKKISFFDQVCLRLYP